VAPVTGDQVCWICGDPGTTGEHGVKRSDLKALYPDVSQQTPLYLHLPDGGITRIQGLNSDALKLASKLCPTCNNTRTQPHDRAWETLAQRLRQPEVRAGHVIRLSEAFSALGPNAPVDLQLYFAKLTGCLAQEGGIPIDIAELADAIKTGRPCPDLYLRFGKSPPDKEVVGIVGAEVIRDDATRKVVGMSWYYNLGLVLVHVIHTPSPHLFASLCVDAWHPGGAADEVFVHDYGPLL
jgi:hypothetical protein